MKLVHLTGESRIEVIETTKPVPGFGEVVVRTVVTALCGSELGAYRGAGVKGGNPGHEAVGVVELCGEGADAAWIGRRVAVTAVVGCGSCAECDAGRPTWCPHRRGLRNMHAEYIVAPLRACLGLPDDVPWDVGVLIGGDGFGVPIHSAGKLAGRDVSVLVVLGLGPIGLGHVLLHAHQGRTVIGVDPSATRRRQAQRLGARHVLAGGAKEDIREAILALNHGVGADACIEAAGQPATAQLSFTLVRPGGIVIFNGEQPRVELSPSDDFIRRDISAVGSWYFHLKDFTGGLACFRAGMPIGSLVTERFPFEHAAEGYAMMAAATSGKVLLNYY